MKCPCGASTPGKDTGNYGDIMRQTGYTPVMCHDGETVWLCRKCAVLANELAAKLLKIVGRDTLYFPHLLKDPGRADASSKTKTR